MQRAPPMVIELVSRRLLAKAAAILACMACVVALSSCSGDEASVGDRADAGSDDKVDMNAAGRDKSIPCLACHGAEGISDYDVWPNLAGQNTEYLAKQMRDFRAGHRHDPWMSPMAGPLSDQDIDDMAAYFSSVTGVTGGPNSAPPPAMICVACHSADAGETNPLWPSLAGQNQRYLVKQLRDFRDGRRTDPVMAPLAVALSDQDIEALAAFYASP
jgi:cytochrome c553